MPIKVFITHLSVQVLLSHCCIKNNYYLLFILSPYQKDNCLNGWFLWSVSLEYYAFLYFFQVVFAQYDFILMPVWCGIRDKDNMKHVPMGSHCMLLVADTKHNTIWVIDFIRGGMKKKFKLTMKVCNINARLWMQIHKGYTVVYSICILAKQLNVIVEFTSLTFTFLSMFTVLSILRFQ